jgi:Rad3-related DNA helicase
MMMFCFNSSTNVPPSQLVVLPYNTLLHGPTREAVGVKLKGNVVIIDEAHNLLDTIASVYSVEITGAHVGSDCYCKYVDFESSLHPGIQIAFPIVTVHGEI